jgi:hypothetical protein
MLHLEISNITKVVTKHLPVSKTCQHVPTMEGLPFLAGGGGNLTRLQIVDIIQIFSYFFRHGFNN